jgi:hypothetical protein
MVSVLAHPVRAIAAAMYEMNKNVFFMFTNKKSTRKDNKIH